MGGVVLHAPISWDVNKNDGSPVVKWNTFASCTAPFGVNVINTNYRHSSTVYEVICAKRAKRGKATTTRGDRRGNRKVLKKIVRP